MVVFSIFFLLHISVQTSEINSVIIIKHGAVWFWVSRNVHLAVVYI